VFCCFRFWFECLFVYEHWRTDFQTFKWKFDGLQQSRHYMGPNSASTTHRNPWNHSRCVQHNKMRMIIVLIPNWKTHHWISIFLGDAAHSNMLLSTIIQNPYVFFPSLTPSAVTKANVEEVKRHVESRYAAAINPLDPEKLTSTLRVHLSLLLPSHILSQSLNHTPKHTH
jgi:hypothetical protein